MNKTADWLNKNTRIADWGHGDTLEGQMMKRTLKKLTSKITELRQKAALNQMDEVLPRWRGDLRREIFQLPPVDKLKKLSMSQLNDLESKIDTIEGYMNRYNAKRFWERAGNANKS